MQSVERTKQIIPVLAFPPMHSRVSTPGAVAFPTYIRISVEIRAWLNVGSPTDRIWISVLPKFGFRRRRSVFACHEPRI